MRKKARRETEDGVYGKSKLERSSEMTRNELVLIQVLCFIFSTFLSVFLNLNIIFLFYFHKVKNF